MARSPIRGLDPHNETGSGSSGAAGEAKTMAVETIAVESAPSAESLSGSVAADDKSSEATGSAEASAEAESGTPAPPAGGRAPLKKPLGLSLRKPAPETKAAPATVVVAPPMRKSSIDEAIELALASASTAVDSAQEIQRLRAELQKVSDASRQADRTLFGAMLVVVLAAGLGLSWALTFYSRSIEEFTPAVRANRDALLTFTGEVRGLVENGKTIADAVKVSETALSVATAQTEEIRKAIQSFTAAQIAVASKIPPAEAYEKPLAALTKPLEELAAVENTINTRLIEIQQAQAARRKVAATPVETPAVEPPKVAPKPERPAANGADSLIRYP